MEEKKNKNVSFDKMVVIYVLIGLFISFLFSLYYNSELEHQLNDKDQLISNLIRKDSLLHQVLDFEYDSINGQEYYYTMKRKDGKILKYNELSNMLDSLISISKMNIDTVRLDYMNLIKQYNEVHNNSIIYKSALDQIQKRYDISYYVDSISKDTKIVRIEAKRLDSALILYPYYKNKIINMEYKGGTIKYEVVREKNNE